MSQTPKELQYTKEHEWIQMDGNRARIGITDFAQNELGDIVFVELPEAGASVKAGETFGTVESVKTVSDLFSPVSGRVTRINEALAESPEKVNEQPYGEGWLIEVEVSETPAGLLSADEYNAHIAD